MNKLIKSCTDADVTIYNSTQLMQRTCIPLSATISQSLSGYLEPIPLDEWFSDLEHSWQLILICAGAGFIIAFSFILLMRYCTAVLVWLMFIFFLCGIGFLSFFLYEKSKFYL